MTKFQTTVFVFVAFIASQTVAQPVIIKAINLHTIPAITIGKLVTRDSLQKPAIDQTFCKKWLAKYLATLDPAKLYFLRDDIAEFETYLERLPKIAKTGDDDFYKLVTKRYQQRAESALANAIKRLDQSFDFSIDEEFSLRNDQWTKTKEDRIERWRLQLKYDLLVERSHITSGSSDGIEFLRSRCESIRKQVNDLTEEKALGLYLNSFCKTVGPHTTYLTPKLFMSFSGSFAGTAGHTLGIVLDQTEGKTMIVSVSSKFHGAQRAAKLIGCELVAVRSQTGDVYHCREIDLSTTCNFIGFGLNQESEVTVELFDEINRHRFAVSMRRRQTN